MKASNGFFNSLREFNVALRYRYLVVLRILQEMPVGQGIVCLIAIPMFFLFLFKNRFIYFFDNISNTISGVGDPVFLIIDGLFIILMILGFFFMVTHIAMYDGVLPQRNNHQALQPIDLPDYIEYAYLPLHERIKLMDEENQIEDDIEHKNSLLNDLLGIDPNLISSFESLTDNSPGSGFIEQNTTEDEDDTETNLAREIANTLNRGALDAGLDILDVNLIESVAKELELIEEKPKQN